MRVWGIQMLMMIHLMLGATVLMLPLNMPECIRHGVGISARAQTRLAGQKDFLVLWVLATLPSLPIALM